MQKAVNEILAYSRVFLSGTTLAVLLMALPAFAGTWVPLNNLAPAQINTMLLLSDGSVICEEFGYFNNSTAWFRLTPDVHGSYVNGTWSSLASMHNTRLFFSSQILTNGNLFVAGGEYGTGTSTAETYDPLANTWTLVPQAPPEGLSDAISMMLPDGRVLLGPANASGQTVIYNLVAGTATLGPTAFGGQNEASWVKLPDKSILTIDEASQSSERYIPSLNQWVKDATVPVPMYSSSIEIGAALLLPNGKAFFLGASGHTALYTTTGTTNSGTWTAGPNIPSGLTPPDAPAAMLVDGNVLCAVTDQTNTYFYEYNPTANNFTQVNGPTGIAFPGATDYLRMLDLPDGTVLFGNNGQQFYVYQPSGSPLAAGKPAILSISTNSIGSYHLVGTLLNGISAGAAYGDDAQMDSNYPIIRMTNSSGVYYLRTFNWNSTGVMTSNLPVSTEFTVPTNVPAGAYSLFVIANGISSGPVAFVYDLPVLHATHNGSGLVLTWNTYSNQTYQVQYTTNLSQGNWLGLGNPIPATNSVISVTNSSTDSRRFYRLQLQ